MTSGHVPRLRLSDNTRQSVNEYGMSAWIILFSLLFDPEVDDEYKRRHASDMILFTDESLYVAYRILVNGDLYIGFVHNEADIDRLNPQ